MNKSTTNYLAHFEGVSHWAELHNNLAKTPKSLWKKRFVDALGGQEDSPLESQVAEPTLCNKLLNWQANTLLTHRPLGTMKTKDELANGRTREQTTCAHAQASLKMARATQMKVKILQGTVT